MPLFAFAVSKQGVSSVQVADLIVPTQPAGDIWLHFSRIETMKARYVSASSVLDGSIDPDMLSGKLVLLGLTGSGLHDMRTTALGELVPGIEIQAQVLESLFDGRIIARPWWMKWLETTMILLLGLLLIWYIPRRNSPLARFIRAVPRASAWITLAINLMLVGIGYLLFRYQAILFDAFFILSHLIQRHWQPDRQYGDRACSHGTAGGRRRAAGSRGSQSDRRGISGNFGAANTRQAIDQL